MSLRRRPGLITLYPRRVQITQVDNVDDGLRMLVAVRDLLNQTWARQCLSQWVGNLALQLPKLRARQLLSEPAGASVQWAPGWFGK